MKKFISILLALVLVCGMAVTALADDTVNVTLSTNKSAVCAGETVEVTLSVDKAVSNLLTYQFNVIYDASLVEIAGSTIGGASNLTVVGDPGAAGENKYVPVSGLSVTGDAVALEAGVVATITFKANEDITKTETAVFDVVVEALTDYDELTEYASSAIGTSIEITTDMHEHTWDEGVVTTEPTLDAEGEKTYTCSVCGETKVEPVDKLTPPDKGDDTTVPDDGGDDGEEDSTTPDEDVTVPDDGDGEEDTTTPPADDEGTATPPSEGGSDTPDTGDNSRMIVMIIAAVVCVVGIAILSFKKKLLDK